MSATDFGFCIGYTAPGNLFVLSTQSVILVEMNFRSKESAIDLETTIFTIFNESGWLTHRLKMGQKTLLINNFTGVETGKCPFL